MIGIVAMTGIVGVHTIGTLRREAFAARQLGQYRLKQRLGSGGMGEVYLAEHQMMKRPCAVKLIRPEKAGDPRMLARFEREVRRHRQALALELDRDLRLRPHRRRHVLLRDGVSCPGRTSARWSSDYGPLPPAACVYLHGAGLRRPGRGPRHRPGASRHQAGATSSAPSAAACSTSPSCSTSAWPSRRRNRRRGAQLTLEGTITGSPLFMSPEQASGDDERRRPQRHLLARRGDVLHAHRPAAVPCATIR